jgi:hypothetical protein
VVTRKDNGQSIVNMDTHLIIYIQIDNTICNPDIKDSSFASSEIPLNMLKTDNVVVEFHIRWYSEVTACPLLAR